MADPPEGAATDAPREDDGGRRLDRKTLVPVIVIAAVLLIPLAIWAATSGGSGDKLRIEQNVSYITGGPEIVVAIPKKYNYMSESGNKANVVLVCFDASGKTLFRTNQQWPFINEPGYDLPHIHQPVSEQQMQQIANCTILGLKHKLKGDFRRNRKV